MSEWIAVEKQMPPLDTRVVVYCNYSADFFVERLDMFNGEYQWAADSPAIHITHWMLPEAPKGTA